MSREEIEPQSRAAQHERDDNDREAARRKFESREGLREAINAKVLPTIYPIERIDGVEATGFFYHSNWFVSNAHAVPHEDHLMGAAIISPNSEKIPLISEESYHRPWLSEQAASVQVAPDVVVVKTNVREQRTCLFQRFFDDDEYIGHHTFYVDPYALEGEQIKFLKQVSQPGRYPIIYTTQEGSEPQPGCSGTPIIRARVAISDWDDFPWQFEVIGVLYARCSAHWYNNSDLKTDNFPDESMLVCAIPVKQEFQQIKDITDSVTMAERRRQMGSARRIFDEEEKAQTEFHKAEEEENNARAELERYKFGNSSLPITLIEGLEPLFKRWQSAAYGHPSQRPQKPNLPDGYANAYQVAANHGTHHIIPMEHLLYLWDYLHHLHEDQYARLREEVKIGKHQFMQTELEKLKSKIDTTTHPNSNDRQHALIAARDDIKTQANSFARDVFNDRVKKLIEQQYGRFHLLLAVLCEPGYTDKRMFAWAFWNLFQGWDRPNRTDDPSLPGNRDRSEQVKPQSFSPNLWNALKHPETGLYKRIQELRQLQRPDERTENNLYASMSVLAGIWKNTPQKTVHPFDANDWEAQGQRYRLKS